MSSCVPGVICLPSVVLISFDIVFLCGNSQTRYTGSLGAALNNPSTPADGSNANACRRKEVICVTGHGRSGKVTVCENIGTAPRANVGTAMTSPTGGFGKSYESGDQAQPSTPSISEAPAAGFGGAPVIVEPCFVEGCGVGVLRRGVRRR